MATGKDLHTGWGPASASSPSRGGRQREGPGPCVCVHSRWCVPNSVSAYQAAGG